MSKTKLNYKCTNCDYRPPRWVGCCPECSEWNSVVEFQATQQPGIGKKISTTALTMVPLTEIKTNSHRRLLSGIQEWDRVLGDGIMPNSFLILTGDPGIGKSTLLLQVAHAISQHHRVFYFSSEESLEQVKVRAERLGCASENLLFSDQARLEAIVATVETDQPDLVVVDSIQNCYASEVQTLPGSIGQLRETSFQLMRLAKEHNVAIIVSGHITKDGNIAGPKMLEHMVDGVFYLQGEDRWQTRVLRSVKNRFGSINELGFFEMETSGLKEVSNINEELLNATNNSPGASLISYLEGSRPLLLELQALTIASKYPSPQRVVTNLDYKRLVLIAAILEKYLKIRFSAHDIFFKVSGGFTIKDSSSDLGIALALLSSYFQKSLPEKSIALGEISLTGHIKPVNLITRHLNEATTYGIKVIFISHNQSLPKTRIKVKRLHNVFELMELFIEAEDHSVPKAE
ncbi:DNA repair protein RadA [Candidatus Babeliales bacterium]|nr:DNA repair protein RadA [Candidatus Babeliales bacterium]